MSAVADLINSPSPECCRTCLYYKPKGSRCRRFPPVLLFDLNTVKRETAWPNVNMDMWCGEYSRSISPAENDAGVRAISEQGSLPPDDQNLPRTLDNERD